MERRRIIHTITTEPFTRRKWNATESTTELTGIGRIGRSRWTWRIARWARRTRR
mgnify:CR=1 FL=1